MKIIHHDDCYKENKTWHYDREKLKLTYTEFKKSPP